MIDVKEAAQIAVDYLNKIPGYSEYAKSSSVEEIELTEDERCWLVTLGFRIPVGASAFDFLGNTKVIVKYKIFKIDAQNGKVYSMKIRNVN